MAAIITATRSSLFAPGGDQDGDGIFDPGDIILTRIRITNSGDAPASGISVEDSLNGVTLDGTSIQITPIAFDDAFNITGNTPITFTAAQLLGNDIDPDTQSNAGLTITGVANGSNGTIVNNGNGTYTFTPATGLNVNDTATFQYTITDPQNLSSVTTGVVTLTITDVVWYVDNTYVDGAGAADDPDGSYLRPFTSLAPLNNNGVDVDAAGETIFVFHNGANYTSGIALEAGQKLIGDRQDFMANGHNIGGTSRTTGTDTVLTEAVISQASGTILTLSTDNTVKGLILDAAGANAIGMADGGTGVTSSAAGAELLVEKVSFTGLGQAVDIDAGGNLDVTIDSLTSTGAGTNMQGVQLAGTASSGTALISGSFIVNGGNIAASNSHGFQIGGNGPSSGGTVAVTYGGTIGSSLNGSAVNIADRIALAGDINFTGAIFQNSGASNSSAGISISSIAAGNINFTGTKTIEMDGNPAAGAQTADGQHAISINSQSGGSINFTGGAINIDFSGDTTGSAFSIGSQTGGSVNVSTTSASIDVDFADSASGSGISIVSAGTPGGSVNFTGGGLTISTLSGDGISVANTNQGTGQLNISNHAGNTITTATGQIIQITNGTTTGMTFDSLTSGTTVGSAIDINNLDGGTFTTGGTTIGGSSVDAINIRGGSTTNFVFNGTTDVNGGTSDGVELNATSGSVTFNNLTIDGVTGGNGLSIQNATGAVTVTNGAIGTGTNTGDAVNITGGNGNVVIGATLSKNVAGNVVEVSSHTGGNIDFTSAINASATAAGINLVNNSGGTIDFTHATVNLATGNNNAINFTNTNATGAAVTFTGGNLNIDTNNGIGINATNSNAAAGSLTISGSNNVVDKTGSTNGAIFIQNVTSNVNLLHVNHTVSTSSTIIYVKDNGATGSFAITGDNASTNGSGGTLNGSTGADLTPDTTGTGVFLQNASNVLLEDMTFNGTYNNYGIYGLNVTNFTLRDSLLTGTQYGSTDAGPGAEAAVKFGRPDLVHGLTGTALFEGNTIQNGAADNLAVYAFGSGTALNLTIRDNASSGQQAIFNANHATLGNDSVHIETGGTRTATINVTGVDFNGARGDQLQIAAVESAVQNITIASNTFDQSMIGAAGGGMRVGGGGNGSYNVTYNINNNVMTGATDTAIGASFGGTGAIINGIIQSNTIGTAGGGFQTALSQVGSLNGTGINVGFDKNDGGTGSYAVRIQGNTIRDIGAVNGGGIVVQSSAAGNSGVTRVEATVLNNNVAEMGPNSRSAFMARIGGQGSTDNAMLGLNLQNNVFTAGTDNAVYLDQISSPSRFYVPGYGGSGNGELNIYGPVGTASDGLTKFWANLASNPSVAGSTGNNTLTNGGPIISMPGKTVWAGEIFGLTNSPFVLGVPMMAAAEEGMDWETAIRAYYGQDGLPGASTPEAADAGAGTGTGTGDSTTGGDMTGGGSAAGGDMGAGGKPADPPADDGKLSQGELATLVEAAIQRWIDAGASDQQVAAMRAVKVGIIDMSGVYVGSAQTGIINVDSDGAGYGWFVDSTPGEDGEFAGSGTDLQATAGGGAAGRLDLLTVLMHELGHQIGLEDTYTTSQDDSLMYGYIRVGERRLPEDGEAAGATPGTVQNEAFAVIAPTVGTLPPNKTVDVYFRATINAQEDKYISPLMNTATIKVGGVTVTTANENNALDSLTLGNVVYLDSNKNGQFDAGEGVAGVSVSLYADTNNSGGWDAGDVKLGASQLTLGGGLYSFAGLAPGDYIVVIDATSFNSGQPLNGRISYAGGADPDNNVDNDDNGVAGIAGLGAGIASQTITLAYNSEPDGTPDIDGDTDGDTNLSLDFGFITPNSAPTSTNLEGDIATYVEGATPVRLDVGTAATLADGNANFAGGTLTVAIGTGADTSDDVLSIATTAAVTLGAGSTVLVGGTPIGTYAGGTGGIALTITFNSNANAANVDDLLQALQYNNSDTVNPSNDTRAVSITLVDGGGNDGGVGADTLVINTLVNVTDVNDAPDGGAGNADTTNDLTTLVFTASDFSTGFADPDGNSFDGIVITSLPSVGTLKLNNVNVTAPQAVTLADLNGGLLTYVPAAGTGGQSPTFQYAVKDNGGTLNSGIDTDPSASTFTITITASNAAPVVDLDSDGGGTGFASAYSEGGAAAAISDTDVVITDADSGDDIVSATITITNPELGDALNVGTLPATVTVHTNTGTMVRLVAAAGTSAADFATAIEAITFSSSSDDPTDKGTNLSRSITVTVNDGDSESAAATATIAITDVNDAPAGTSSTITAVEDSFRLLAGSDFGIVDVDGVLGSVTISAVSGGAIYVDSDGGAGAGGFVLETLPKTYSAQDLIDGKVAFMAGPDANGSAVGTITFTIADDDGTSAASANVLTVDVTAINDRPTLAPSASPVAATEQTAVAILTGITVADVDLDALNGGSGNYAGAQFSVNRNSAASTDDIFTLVAGPNFTIDGTNLKTTGGQVFATITANNPGLIVISFNSSGAIATSALVDEVVQSVRYTNINNNPPASVVLAYGLVDGAPGGGQGAVVAGNNVGVELVTVNIAPVNDAPVNSLGGGIGTGEDAVDAWLSGMSIADPDANPATDELSFVFEVEHGTLEILTNVSGGITAGNIVTQDSNTIVIRATLNQINATLSATNGLTYSPDANYNGPDTLTVTTDDRGFTGADPGLSGTLTSEAHVSTRAISISAQPDAPVAQPDSISTPEDTVGTGDLFANNGSGVDSDADGDTLSISAVNGSSANLNTPIALANGGTVTVQSDGTYSFNPAGQYNTLTNPSGGEVGAVNTSATAGTFQYTLTDGNTVTVTLTVTGVAGPGDWLAGDGTDNTISGTPNGDFFFVVQGGNDDLSGLGGDDVFFFDGAMTSADQVDGGGGIDQIALQGNYSGGLTFGADVLGVENLAIMPGNDTRFGDSGANHYDYNITLLDVNVATGVQMIIDANRLRLGEDFTFNGAAETDGSFFIYGGGGTDNLTGGANDDVFLFGAQGQWGASDVVNGGPGGTDQLALRGDYTITFGAAQLVGIEQIGMVSAFDTRFGALGATYDYNVTMNDGNVAGIQMTVDAAPLRSNETLVFNGSAEDDGSFRVFGGQGNDSLTGSQNGDILTGHRGADNLTGGGGADFFRYYTDEDSTATSMDQIHDFLSGMDKIDLSRIDADEHAAGDQAFRVISTGFTGNGASSAGELRVYGSAGTWFIEGDTDGDGDADLMITVTLAAPLPITQTDLIL
ncbi:MAG TPA: cadherin-like domain-containing protein [Allosphingosinicella sp.]|jgi:hypothetical protein